MKRLLHKLEDFFIPHKGNDYLPDALDRKAFYVYLILALGLILSSSYVQFSHLASLAGPVSFTDGDVVELVNNTRSAHNLTPLQKNPVLEEAALEKARDMMENGYFAHFSPDGTSPWYFFQENGYNYRAAGENLAMDFVRAQDAHKALMNSPTHRSNILSPQYEEVGVAVVQGKLNDKSTVFIVQMFGSPISDSSIASTDTGDQVAESEPSDDEASEESTVLGESSPSEEVKEKRQDKSEPEVKGDAWEPRAESEKVPVQPSEPPEKKDKETVSSSTSTPAGSLSKKSEVCFMADVCVSAGFVYAPFSLLETIGKSPIFRVSVAAFILVLVLTTLLVLIRHMGRATPEVVARILILVLVFGYVFVQVGQDESLSAITPVAVDQDNVQQIDDSG